MVPEVLDLVELSAVLEVLRVDVLPVVLRVVPVKLVVPLVSPAVEVEHRREIRSFQTGANAFAGHLPYRLPCCEVDLLVRGQDEHVVEVHVQVELVRVVLARLRLVKVGQVVLVQGDRVRRREKVRVPAVVVGVVVAAAQDVLVGRLPRATIVLALVRLLATIVPCLLLLDPGGSAVTFARLVTLCKPRPSKAGSSCNDAASTLRTMPL